ncbi:MAG: sigma 54-interacting transcriptional regulator [Planctomycetota bacterium]
MSGTDDFFAGLDETKQELSSRRGTAAEVEGRWRVLFEISSLFASPVYTFNEILELILDRGIAISGADRGLLLLYDDKDRLEVKLAKGMDMSALPKEEREVSESVIQDVVKSEQGICIANVEQDSKFSELSSIIDLKILSVMCVPLKMTLRDERQVGKEHRAETLTTRKILGVLYVDSRSVTKSFSGQDLELFQALANNATAALLSSTLYRAATCDPATGIYTRTHFEQRLRDEVKLARKTGSPLSVLMIDIDHLRRLNTERGYVESDRVIQRVARLVQNRLRGIDLVARYGGGKFVAILPQTDATGTEAVANKILGAVSGEDFFGRIGSITCSVGAATLVPGVDVAGLVKRADQALFDAKRSGRNTYRLYHDGLANIRRTDQLAGVLSGDPTRDYRNTLMLLETIEEINKRADFDELLPKVVDTLVDITQADRGFLILKEDDGHLTPRVARQQKRDIEAKDFSRSVLDRVIQTNQAVREAFAEDGPVSSASISNFAIRAVMCVPLLITSPDGGTRTLGAIYVDTQTAGEEFDESSLAFFDTLSRQVAVAIENARLYDRVAQLNRQLQAKLETTEQELESVRIELEDRTKSLELRYNYDQIVGQSPRMQTIFQLLDRVTDTTVPVFIHGESGTGKELVAKAIHYNGPRKKFRLISENCAATSETLLESELFGYVKGAFTGAQADRKGLFELASKGTLFLDEVGDMSLGMQKKLLRVLQEGEIRRVGGKDQLKVDVRIISASNKDLKKLVEDGHFREDLYYRLNVVKVDLPPLRERKEDLPLLIEHFLKEELTGPPKSFSPEAMQMLMRYNWPGNIRELKNVVERAKIISDGDAMGKEHIILDTVFDPRHQGGVSAMGPATGVPRPGAPMPGVGGAPDMPAEPYYFDLNDRQRKLLDYLKTYGSIKNRDYYEIMQVSKSTGWRDIKALIEKGIVLSHGKGKGSVYTLSDGAHHATDV